MQFKALVFASLAVTALGQVTSTSAAPRATDSSTCAAQYILDACVNQTKGQVNSCMANDWDCLCTAYGVVLTCYNNCPGDPNVYSVQQQRDQYCAAATVYGTKTSSRTGSTVATSATSTPVQLTASSSTASATAKATGNAASSLQVGSGMIAVAIAGLGLLA